MLGPPVPHAAAVGGWNRAIATAGSSDIRSHIGLIDITGGAELMSKTTVDVNDEKVEEVKAVLGTRTLRDTIDRALDTVLTVSARQRLIERLRRMDGLELDDPAVMDTAWR